jgi:hypothetical protein
MLVLFATAGTGVSVHISLRLVQAVNTASKAAAARQDENGECMLGVA